MTDIPLACWDGERRVIFVHAKAHAAEVRIDAGHNVASSVALVDPTELLAELTTARNEVAALSESLDVERGWNEVLRNSAAVADAAETARLREENAQLRRDYEALGDRDPFGPYPAFRSAVCDNPGCACAVPSLPCREFMGIRETGPYCPRCSWNEAGHDRYRKARADATERWLASRLVVATVYKITRAEDYGLWEASCGDFTSVRRTHAEAVAVAHQMAKLGLADQEPGEIRVGVTRTYEVST